MLIRPERPQDIDAVRTVHTAAFERDDGARPVEVGLLDALRRCEDWIPALSLVAEQDDTVVGHVVCTRGHVGGHLALGLGPIGVLPANQGSGVGAALMHAVLAAADARGERLVALLGDPAYYRRFDFVPSTRHRIDPPDPTWGPYFQVRPLTAHDGTVHGTFRYAAPFADLGG
ncbi:GNAT family N-acetyltransferase [Allosaccharopolyspora coralli]|uniref:GNAT family N-acetyltransferase n=1 Tax=Allosaccharopolyspora coralli TaxID=2665642 RepID=A0A5Q3QIS4_9PSEU|nr:N-acetyltransferase [Allosaccharopolyspora coralli]QGK71359.1 GNAT family N-acetyltransferase [Allosaccharopolyspora coralli]